MYEKVLFKMHRALWELMVIMTIIALKDSNASLNRAQY